MQGRLKRNNSSQLHCSLAILLVVPVLTACLQASQSLAIFSIANSVIWPLNTLKAWRSRFLGRARWLSLSKMSRSCRSVNGDAMESFSGQSVVKKMELVLSAMGRGQRSIYTYSRHLSAILPSAMCNHYLGLLFHMPICRH